MDIIKIGTDCSGIEAPLEALRQLKIPFIQEFSSEINESCIISARANFPEPRIFHKDITARKHNILKNLHLDIYVAGFPCQPFSSAGKKLHSLDPRSNILSHCIETIKMALPKIFILENVKNFMNIDEGKMFKETIQRLKLSGKYNVYSQVLNTEHFNIPQNRERLFIIGIRKDVQKREFTFPCEKKKTKDIKDFLLNKPQNNIVPPSIAQVYQDHKHKIQENLPVILSTGSFGTASNISPTITHSHKHYLWDQRRYMSGREALNLQGFSKKFKVIVSDTDICRQAGNSMSVNVLKALFSRLFKSI